MASLAATANRRKPIGRIVARDSITSTSLSLLARAKAFDNAAWERLAKLYTPLVIRWARNANIKESEIADVVQEVFQAVAKSISKFESGPGLPPFRGWLWGITRNKINDFFRRTLNQANAVGGTDAQIRILELAEFEPDSNADSSVASEHDSLAARALELMKTDFTETTWKAFWQVTVENKSPAEVSAEIGISIGSVYTAKSRVLARLRNELAGLT